MKIPFLTEQLLSISQSRGRHCHGARWCSLAWGDNSVGLESASSRVQRINNIIFTALHWMPSVCPSVRHNRVLWQSERKFCRRSYTMWMGYSSSFLTRRMVRGGRPLLREILGANWPCRCKSCDFQSIVARSTSDLRPREKSSIITNRKSTTRFPMSLRWTSYPASEPPKRGLQTQSDRFLPVFARYL